METLLLIVGIHAVVLGFACIFGGFLVIGAPSDAEINAMRADYESRQAKGWLHGQFFNLAQVLSFRPRALSTFLTHWPERPEGRRLIYVGGLFLAIAAAIGYHFGVFSS